MEETVEIKVKLPKAIVDFIKEFDGDVEGYIEEGVVEILRCDIEHDLNEWGEIIDRKKFLQRYPGLRDALYPPE